MCKRLLTLFIAVLLLSSGAFAAIGQVEGFSVNAFNVVERFGVGSAEGGNMIMVGHAQESYDVFRGIGAVQDEAAVLTQSASTTGFRGAGVVDQDASAEGGQSQVVVPGIFGSRSAGQNLSIGLNSIAFNAGGIGAAAGEQSFVGEQNQLEITPRGISSSSQFVGVDQFTSVSGGPWSDVEVNNGLNVDLTQDNMVIGGPSAR